MRHLLEQLQEKVPEPTRNSFSLIDTDIQKFSHWAQNLPMLNLGESSRTIFSVLKELTLLNCTSDQRLAYLEILRPIVHTLTKGLSKHYLGQPIGISPKALQISALAQALQGHLALNYQNCTLHFLSSLQKSPTDKLILNKKISLVIHRAISELSLILVRNEQLYLAKKASIWQDIYTLYLLAEKLMLCHEPIVDKTANKYREILSIQDRFKQAILFSTARPNKLRQHDISQVYQLSELWTSRMHLMSHSNQNEDCLFITDLFSDEGPFYTHQLNPEHQSHMLSINVQELVAHLEALKLNAKVLNPKAHGEEALTIGILQHLIEGWQQPNDRSFNRNERDGKIEICLGLSAAHYYLSNEEDFEYQMSDSFEKQLQGISKNRFLTEAKPKAEKDERVGIDAWSDAYKNNQDNDAFAIQFMTNVQAKKTEPSFPCYSVGIVNESPSGYCLKWQNDISHNIKVGELIAFREFPETQWGVAVIRWLKQIPERGIQFGVETLGFHATPCGAKVIKKNGEVSEYLRCLILPEIKAIGRPTTLIAPTLAFREHYKIALKVGKSVSRAQITQMLSSTPSFSQLEFKLLQSADLSTTAPSRTDIPIVTTTDVPEKSFDDIWGFLP